MEDHPCLLLRRLWTRVDSIRGAPESVCLEEVQVNTVGQRWNRWEDAGVPNKGGAEPKAAESPKTVGTGDAGLFLQTESPASQDFR